MQILEAYDLTGSLRGAAALSGCDHKTVARRVAAREAVRIGERSARFLPRVRPNRTFLEIDEFHDLLAAAGELEATSTSRRSGR
jgi:hypothetical protein